MKCKYKSNLSPFWFGLLVDFVCLAWIEANSVLSGNSYLFVTVTDEIPYSNFTFKYCILVGSNYFHLSHSPVTRTDAECSYRQTVNKKMVFQPEVDGFEPSHLRSVSRTANLFVGREFLSVDDTHYCIAEIEMVSKY